MDFLQKTLCMVCGGTCAARTRLLLPLALLLTLWVAPVSEAQTYDIPPWLPRYDLDVKIDVDQQFVTVRERVTWTNPCGLPTNRVLFNNHSHYTIPDKDIGLLAKSLEILRLAPSEVFDFNGPPGNVTQVDLVDPVANTRHKLDFFYREDNQTALEVVLPFEVKEGQSVNLELAFTLRLPQRQGRWGQWRGVTFLAQWLPVVACYGPQGWKPTPFVPWHQPFCNEAGIYRAKITLPCEEKIGCTGSIKSVADLGNGWQQVTVGDVPARDFAIFCSKHYREVVNQVGGVRIRCLHLAGHEFYGQQMVRIASEAIPTYSQWFGQFPYPEFTVVESYFGWNGNECGGVIMIDERIFCMPHMAVNYVDSLLTHEICHQWFYNTVGTDGYAETWMDEGLATYFCHRAMDLKLGKNNPILQYPTGLGWLPNIHRDDFRNYGFYGVLNRGEAKPTVQEMPKFGHLVNLMGMTYDRGSRIVGMIEEQVGPGAFLDFMKIIYRKYHFRILRVADFQRELEAYTGRSWQEFFTNWLYGSGTCDWAIDRVEMEPLQGRKHKWNLHTLNWVENKVESCLSVFHKKNGPREPQKVVVYVKQKAQYSEPTVLGISLDGSENYQIRIPIFPDMPVLVVEECAAKVEAISRNLVRVELTLPCKPTQITVDPDQVLLDCQPANNCWKQRLKIRWTPFYNQLDETDITTAYDRLNFIAGPWAYFATFNNPWYTLSPMIGLRAGLYRTHEFYGGTYLAYRSNDRNLIAGIDGLIDHAPYPNTQIGFNVERSLANLDGDDGDCSRGVIFGRWVKMYSSSLYLPPFEYLEVFGSAKSNCLPDSRQYRPKSEQFDNQTAVGIHYHKYYLTPYWDPEGGVALDLTYQEGLPVFGSDEFHNVYGQISYVKYMPDPFGLLKSQPALSWLADSRWAFRFYGAAALPDQGQFFSLGGGELFRGYDLAERQGSLVWLGSVEWRVPIVKGLRYDCLDHVAGLRNIYAVAFYDVGNAYLNGRQLGPIAHAVGGSLRFDVSWLGLIERTMLRFDVARTVNDSTPWQFWFGIQHPF